jgi:hypothetical protein
MKAAIAVISLALVAGCGLELDPPSAVIRARFDPDAKVIPMPSDVLRDDLAGRLELPIDDDLSAAERELYQWMNQLDGWSSASLATVELTGPVDPASLTAEALQIWEWRETPIPVDDVRIELSDDRRTITIIPPRTGWRRGGRYAVALRGGPAGLRGAAGERVECDAAFYFLRQTERLDTPEHERAFPGDTAAERRDKAVKLEALRVELAPLFDFFAGRGLPRPEVAALWSFTVTERIEVAMDEASQRMPLPIDLLRDPATGRIDLPPARWDSPTVLHAKEKLAALDGFALSAGLTFNVTGPLDPATVGDHTVELWRLDDAGLPAERIDAAVELLAGNLDVELTPRGGPLPEQTSFAVILRPGLRGLLGEEVILMPAGRLLLAAAPVHDGARSTLAVVDDDDARKVEAVRRSLTALLAAQPSPPLAAWSYRTMSLRRPMAERIGAAAALAVDPHPRGVVRQSPLAAVADFPLAIGSLGAVGHVYHGTIATPVFLDRRTRGFRGDGGHEVEQVPFTMAVPRDLPTDRPAPVVIFGHAIMTERRFVLAVANALALRGFVAVSIDLPLHGTRTHCWTEGPLSVPDPTTGALTPLTRPCTGDATCSDEGHCVDALGQVQPMRRWPIIPMPMASGAAFLEIEGIANTRDHFSQALIDLAALHRSLREGDWAQVIGAPVDPDRIHYAGQSLGGILGASFVANQPGIADAVLNVPGADTVDMFRASPFFGPQVEAFYRREGITADSFDGHRFMNVARWFMDAVDPASFADQLTTDRSVLIQMATLDFIIPNDSTRVLEALSGARRRDYVAEHGFLVIPIEPEYLRGTLEMAAYLDGWRP